ncbi:MAG: glycosidase [Elusimicrobiota bacterium]
MLRANPHLIEINTRLFLNRMREKYAMPDMTLSLIPDDEWLELKHLGFDIVWLMGIWKKSAISADISRDEEFLRDFAKRIGRDTSIISASPYSIVEYKMDENFGFEWELKALKEKLNSFGMKLYLDFVSNHMGIDSNFSKDCVDCFVLADEEDYIKNKELFCEKQIGGNVYYIAHGKDPNFPPWKDTIQLNYFNPRTREKMISQLLKISEVADGVRCDMVMLALNDVHESVWGWLLSKRGYKKPETEFWQQAINEVKSVNPQFTFIAEVYWGLEWRIQQLGFDYTYDKVFYDRLRNMGAEEIRGHLRAEKLYQKKSVRFIDNHDEEPSITAFKNRRKALSAAVMVSTVKGLRFYNDMQLNGVGMKVPVQIAEFDIEKYKDIGVEKFYEKLLKITDHPAFHGGEWELVEVFPINEYDRSFKNIIAFKWTQMRTIKIVVVNYSDSNSGGKINISLKAKGDTIALYEEFSERFFSYNVNDISSGLKIDNIEPYGFYIFDYEF